jgi:hypothetical protein
MHYKLNPSLGGTIRNNFKEWSRTKSGQIVFMELFFSNIFTAIDLFFLMFIYPMQEYMVLSFHWNKKVQLVTNLHF